MGLLPTPPAKPRYHQVSEAEMAEQREKGLCFNYDHKFFKSHRCQALFFLMVAAEDDGPPCDSIDPFAQNHSSDGLAR